MREIYVALTLLVRKKVFRHTKLFSIVLNCVISKVKLKALTARSYQPIRDIRFSNTALNMKPHLRPRTVSTKLSQTH